jgi:hypothetical protein
MKDWPKFSEQKHARDRLWTWPQATLPRTDHSSPSLSQSIRYFCYRKVMSHRCPLKTHLKRAPIKKMQKVSFRSTYPPTCENWARKCLPQIAFIETINSCMHYSFTKILMILEFLEMSRCFFCQNAYKTNWPVGLIVTNAVGSCLTFRFFVQRAVKTMTRGSLAARDRFCLHLITNSGTWNVS